MTYAGNKIFTIVTEGGKKFGFGHITRCISIANIFHQYGYKINFIVNGDESIFSLFNHKPIIFNWINNNSKLLGLLKLSSLILIDSIEISDDQILKIQDLNKPIIFIDDVKRRNILDNGFVVDWTVLSERKNYFYPRKEEVTYLLGSRYAPLRSEFNNAKKNPIRDTIEKVMITFGGTDIRNLTPLILKNLNEFLPNCKKYIIVGNGFTNKKNIERYRDKNSILILNPNAKTIVNLMQNTDLAIASGGQTLYELSYIGTPTIAIILVENAKDDTIGWDKVGSVKNIGWWNDANLISNLKHTIELIQNKNIRQQMQDKAKPYINSEGAFNLVRTILDNL